MPVRHYGNFNEFVRNLNDSLNKNNFTSKFEFTPSQIATLSLLLEVSSSPKSGNVDRMHDFEDLKFEHFLISSVSSIPVFEKAERKCGRIGELIFEAVSKSISSTGRNTHFGAFMLLVPLIYSTPANKACKVDRIAKKSVLNLRNTTFIDSIYVLRAFRISKARVIDVEDMDLRKTDESIFEKTKISFYEWLKLSPKENIVAFELLKGYPASLMGYKIISKNIENLGLNLSVVYAYHKLLSSFLDPLIIARHGYDIAVKVRKMAKDSVKAFESEGIKAFHLLDKYLVENRINPGSIADLTASSIYFALFEIFKLKFDNIII